MSNVFTTFRVINGDNLEIIEVKGKHLFLAMLIAGTDPAKIQREMMKLCILKDGKELSDQYLDELDAYDYVQLGELLAIQMQKTKV